MPFLKTATHARVWWLIDAKDAVLGRMSTRIASLLMGKHKPIYRPNDDSGDFVVVINAKNVTVTGKKAEQKLYRHHSGFPGGLKELAYKDVMAQTPEKIITHAVNGMLPKNNTRKFRMSRLKVFEGPEHPYAPNIFQQVDINQMK